MYVYCPKLALCPCKSRRGYLILNETASPLTVFKRAPVGVALQRSIGDVLKVQYKQNDFAVLVTNWSDENAA